MKAILSLLALAISATAFAQLELTPPVVGPFSIKGHKLWSFGPLLQNGEQNEFTIPSSDPYSRVHVLTGVVSSGSAPTLDVFVDGSWWPVMQLGNSTWFAGFPRPGLPLPPGRYRLDSIPTSSFVCGYLAPPSTFPPYSGMDEYPAANKIFAAHQFLPGMQQFTVPTDKVYVLTCAFGFGQPANVQKKDFNGTWQPFFSSSGQILPLPGLRLAPGDYRIQSGCITGFITTES